MSKYICRRVFFIVIKIIAKKKEGRRGEEEVTNARNELKQQCEINVQRTRDDNALPL
jgi:hypothetical protein